jgi:nucleoside diphosphate kinase
VITPRTQDEADAALVFFASWLNGKANLVHNMVYTDPEKIEQTLVIIKPENWLHASSRPGAIIDMFSRTGLRIIGIKVHRFSLSGAIEFYGAVENALIGKLAPVFGDKAFELLEEEFNIILTPETKRALADSFGRDYARNQYFQILEFMSGKRPDMCPKTEWDSFSDVKCMVVIYEGENAVQKIRNILGPTDPTKAPPGTIRREFGSNVMVNSAHASDSVESYLREKTIVQVEENTLCKIITEYLKNRD